MKRHAQRALQVALVLALASVVARLAGWSWGVAVVLPVAGLVLGYRAGVRQARQAHAREFRARHHELRQLWRAGAR